MAELYSTFFDSGLWVTLFVAAVIYARWPNIRAGVVETYRNRSKAWKWCVECEKWTHGPSGSHETFNLLERKTVQEQGVW